MTDISISGVEPFSLEFSPALPAGAVPVSVLQDGKPITFRAEPNESDTHVIVRVALKSRTRIEVNYEGGIRVDVPWEPLLEGDRSRNLHVLRTSYKKGQYEMVVEGRPDHTYQLRLRTPWKILVAGVNNASASSQDNWMALEIAAPSGLKQSPDKAGYVRWIVSIPLEVK